MPEISVPGKRSLFFTHRKDEERWRLSEKVAAVLEGNFVGNPDNVFTFSTASIPNGTPYPPPLDVVFSATPNPLEAFSFVQVKDYTDNKVKREYIDAVIGQRVQTGIQSCTVVSTTGFTAPALELARVQHVRLRVLQKDAKWPYPDYLPKTLMIRLTPHLQLKAADLAVIGLKRIGKLSLTDEDLLHKVLDIDGVRTSIIDRFNRALAFEGRSDEINSQIKANPNLATIQIVQEFKTSKVRVRTPDGEYPVRTVIYNVLVLRPESLQSAVTHRYLYYDPISKTNMAWCAMADFQMSGVQKYGIEDGLHHFCEWRFPNGENDSVGGAFFPE